MPVEISQTYSRRPFPWSMIGPCLSIFRNVAINIIHQQGYPFISDGWREIANIPDRGLHLLL
jgi:hypothetical protein